jgi:hypothetical protein
MIALLGSLLGFGTSFLPQVLGLFQAKQEHKNKLEMMTLQAKMAAQGIELQLQVLDKQADIAETKGLYAHDQSLDSGQFINALRGSVRPVITYAFFGLFIATKIIVMIKVMNAGGDWMQGVELVCCRGFMWDDETAGLMSAILAFWFGNRAVSKFTGKK